jgi:hypothetical protein
MLGNGDVPDKCLPSTLDSADIWPPVGIGAQYTSRLLPGQFRGRFDAATWVQATFATQAAQNGMDLATLAAILGHSKLDMVLRYAHPQEKHKAELLTVHSLSSWTALG